MDELYCQHCVDASKIIKKILKSQLIIIGTPIFFFNMTTHLKTLWDHLVMVTHPDLKPKIINKKFAFFSVAGSNYKDIAKSFYIDIEETARFFQFDILDTFKVGGFWESGSIQEDKDILKDAYNFGKKISEEAKL
jgi:multimeric flavodoxin WrbA